MAETKNKPCSGRLCPMHYDGFDTSKCRLNEDCAQYTPTLSDEEFKNGALLMFAMWLFSEHDPEFRRNLEESAKKLLEENKWPWIKPQEEKCMCEERN